MLFFVSQNHSGSAFPKNSRLVTFPYMLLFPTNLLKFHRAKHIVQNKLTIKSHLKFEADPAVRQKILSIYRIKIFPLKTLSAFL
ncbi:hypothetical protein BEN74_14005 [Acinetobacter sp. WCHAc010034]|nr:hypothetical protein BEN74_14005 [Acinetobacter sp. WCHAc010034]